MNSDETCDFELDTGETGRTDGIAVLTGIGVTWVWLGAVI